ncbi:patatin-like phospholipase family protein [Rhodoferax sp.]|uniref:patatin-like phospholipase family protein n=1 Tax=Rhodoferax sp. TaxID=50421 RepID=UPI002ACD4845|nr:patatin-like phospholipase family protein [Rhodoferax sp.]MDZ7919391.1 patatin-like phospholipase family protein [Rhodoferax sp.]
MIAPVEGDERDPSILMAVIFSGGGARAAAFGYGVLSELQASRFVWKGQESNLLQKVDLVGGVSGGSIMAAYLATYGEKGLGRFEHEYLRRDFQDSLLNYALRPGNLVSLTSPWFGRSHLLAERLDALYQSATFGDLARRPGHPELLITATDMSLGTGFDFSKSQFDLICSKLEDVPVSFAVAASSAVPLLLSPVTLRNFAGQCPPPAQQGDAWDDYRTRLYRDQARSYLDSKNRPYIHLVDGGLSDNLGVRRMLDSALADGGLRPTLLRTGIAPGTIRKLVLISVNSERDPSANIDMSDRLPGTAEVLDTLLFGAGARATKETQEFLADLTRQWKSELAQRYHGGQDVFAPDAQVHVIQVNLRDAPDVVQRRKLLQVPTALSISDQDVTQLIGAGRTILSESPEFKNLMQALRQDAPR